MDIEQEARTLGWTPREEFKGDPARFVEAEEFVERGRTLMPILRKNNQTLLGEVTTVKQQLATVQASLQESHEALAEFRTYHEQTAERAYQKALKDLRSQKAEAIKSGDGDAVVAAEEAMDELAKTAPKTAAAAPVAALASAPTAPPVHPDVVQWEKDNAVWLAEPEKKAYAHSVASYVRATQATLVGRAFLDAVTAEVEKRFGGSPAPKHEDPGTRTGQRSGHTFNNLPADAKAACDRFAAKLVGPNRAFKTVEEFRKDYVSKYDWS